MVVLSVIAPCAALFGYKFFNESEIEAKRSTAAAPEAVKRIVQYNRNFVFSRRNVQEGRWWTAVTSMFAHHDLLHIFFNMSTLWSLGPSLVRTIGTSRFFFIYFGAGLVGNWLQWEWWKKDVSPYRDAGAVGASGCLFGLVGTMTYMMPTSKVYVFFIPLKIWQASVGIGALSIASLQNDWLPGFGHAAHLGGLLFGGASTLILARTGRLLPIRRFR